MVNQGALSQRLFYILARRKLNCRFWFITMLAVQLIAQEAAAAVCGAHPGATDEGGIVAHVLSMPAGQYGAPGAFFILVVVNDLLSHDFGLGSTTIGEDGG